MRKISNRIAAALGLLGAAMLPATASEPTLYPTAQESAEVLGQLQKMRQDRLLARQPNVLDYMFANGKRQFDAHVTNDDGDLKYGSRKGTNTWTQASTTWTRSDDTRLQYVFAAIGHHIATGTNFYWGAMAQADATQRSLDGHTSDGLGFLVGPYVAGRIPDTELNWSMRLMHGYASNQFSPDGSIQRNAGSQRSLVQARLQGRYDAGDMKLTPNIFASHVQENGEGFTLSNGQKVSGQRLSLSQLSAGIEFDRPLEASWAQLGLNGAFAVVAQHSQGSGLLSQSMPSNDWFTSRVELGLEVDRKGFGNIHTSIGFDGSEGAMFDQMHLSLMFERQL